jgi:hypothetical protein
MPKIILVCLALMVLLLFLNFKIAIYSQLFKDAVQSDLRMCTKEPSFYYTNSLFRFLFHFMHVLQSLKWKSSPFCASVLLITMWGPLTWTLPKFRMFRISLNINSISYSFRSIANQNGVRYSDSTSYFKKYSSSKCKQTVCLHYGLDFHFN